MSSPMQQPNGRPTFKAPTGLPQVPPTGLPQFPQPYPRSAPPPPPPPPMPPVRRRGRGPWLWLGAAVVVVALVVVVLVWHPWAGEEIQAQPSAGGFASDSLGCTPGLENPVPQDSSGWHEAWRADMGEGYYGNSNYWRTYVRGDCLVVTSGALIDKPGRASGYRITDEGLVKQWMIEEEGLQISSGRPWFGDKLVVGDELLDPATGERDSAPWEGGKRVTALSNETAVMCDSFPGDEGLSCELWTAESGSFTQRWKQTYDTQGLSLMWRGVGGDEATGSVAVLLTDEADVGTIGIMSLADGRLISQFPREDEKERTAHLASASNGWIYISPDASQATVLAADGSEVATFTPSGSAAALVAPREGRPTVEQLRAAFETGDVSWAYVVIECSSGDVCAVNGLNVRMPDGAVSKTPQSFGDFQAEWEIASDGKTLLLRARPAEELGGVVMLDVPAAQVIDLGTTVTSPPVVPVARQDLVIRVDGNALVAYKPAG